MAKKDISKIITDSENVKTKADLENADQIARENGKDKSESEISLSKMSREECVEVFKRLGREYPDAETELKYSSTFELLVAVILSAQCTDKRVNLVTDKLFRMYNTAEQFARLENEELEKWIYSCGFYRAKSKNIINASKDIVERFGGRVPETMEELISLAGVGRKTANVMLAVAFNKDALAVDTHVFRVSRRLGMASGNSPLSVEREVVELAGDNELGKKHHLLIFHGRYCCHSRVPNCPACPLTDICRYNRSNKISTIST